MSVHLRSFDDTVTVTPCAHFIAISTSYTICLVKHLRKSHYYHYLYEASVIKIPTQHIRYASVEEGYVVILGFYLRFYRTHLSYQYDIIWIGIVRGPIVMPTNYILLSLQLRNLHAYLHLYFLMQVCYLWAGDNARNVH